MEKRQNSSHVEFKIRSGTCLFPLFRPLFCPLFRHHKSALLNVKTYNRRSLIIVTSRHSVYEPLGCRGDTFPSFPPIHKITMTLKITAPTMAAAAELFQWSYGHDITSRENKSPLVFNELIALFFLHLDLFRRPSFYFYLLRCTPTYKNQRYHASRRPWLPPTPQMITFPWSYGHHIASIRRNRRIFE